ncbi:MAG: universal stress protein [Hyphomicrobiales bacterium]
MTYKTILVHLDDEKRAHEILAAACILAKRYDAHLVGSFVLPGLDIAPAFGFYIPTEVLEVHRNNCLKIGENLKAQFEKASSDAGIAAEFRMLDAEGRAESAPVIEHSRMADLIVMGQTDVAADGPIAREIRERVLMESGRPVLLIPYAGKFETIGSNVLVAWNSRREATRAVFDALPLLKEAENVRLHWVNASNEDGAVELPGAEMAATLARHGVKITAEGGIATEISVADEVLARVSDFGCDLLVMGGYGHSRTRELVFGGVTRSIFEHMTVPVLMSH